MIEGFRDPRDLYDLAIELHDTRKLLHYPSKWAEHDGQIVMKRGEPIEGPVSTKRFPPQREIMDAMGTLDPCTEVTVMGSAQVSKTISTFFALGERIDEHPTHILYVLPTGEKIKEFVAQKWRPFLKSSARLRKKVGQAGEVDNRTQMTFDGGSFTLAPSAPASTFRAQPYEIVVLDDMDALPNTNPDGDIVVLARGRMTMYRLKSPKLVCLSSPTYTNGPIDTRWQASSQEQWHMPCLTCGHEAMFELPMLIWTLGQSSSVHFKCTNCGARILQHQIKAMNERGRWIAVHPERKGYHRGFNLTQAFAPLEFARWTDYAREYEEAEEDFKATGSEEKRMAVRTQRAGLPYESISNAKLDELAISTIERCEQPWAVSDLPCEVITAGVDLGGHGIATTILGTGHLFERWVLDYKNIPGSIRHNSTWDSWLLWLLGLGYPINAICIDASWEQTEVCNRFGLLADPLMSKSIYAWPVKGKEGEGALWPGPIEWGNASKFPYQYQPVTIAVDQAKSAIYDSLSKPAKSGAEVIHFTVDRRKPAKYFRGVFSERRVRPEDRKGPRVQWIPRSSTIRGEPLDTLVYAITACEAICCFADGLRDMLMRPRVQTQRPIVQSRATAQPASGPQVRDSNDLGIF